MTGQKVSNCTNPTILDPEYQSKRKSWNDFVSNLCSHSPINKVWNANRKIKGKGSNKHQHLELGNQVITHKKTYVIASAASVAKRWVGQRVLTITPL